MRGLLRSRVWYGLFLLLLPNRVAVIRSFSVSSTTTTTTTTQKGRRRQHVTQRRRSRNTQFAAGTSQSNEDPTTDDAADTASLSTTPSRRRRPRGVYVRPSAAIERGSGFYVPGLEGSKVRIVGGLILLTLTVFDRSATLISSGGGGTAPVAVAAGNVLAEGLALIYSLLLLLQAAIEQTREKQMMVRVATSSSQSSSLHLVWWDNDDDDEDDAIASASTQANDEELSFRDRVEWAALSYASLTPAATHMILIGPPNDQIRFSLSRGIDSDVVVVGPTEQRRRGGGGCGHAALATVVNSSSGRVAIPETHPAAQLVEEPYRRCIILQQIDELSCWMVASKEPLAAFSKRDLKWLGQLASYVTSSIAK